MPTFSNVHAELDNNELHPPRDFSLAENDTALFKNPLGNLQWHDTYWQRPVLGFADANFPPLTLQHGDRYILFGEYTMGTTAMDTSMDVSIDTSMDSTGVVFPPTETTTVHPTWGEVHVGDVVEFFRTDNKDRPVFEWRAVVPKSGYQVFNLADKSTYYFTGTQWQKQSSASQPVDAQVTTTYTELAQMADNEALVPGLRYWVADRDIVLTAITQSIVSIEGDYTMALTAYGFIELQAGTTGSIDGVEVDGVSLLPSAVWFNTSLVKTATLVANGINASAHLHGFSAVNFGPRVYLIDTAERGAALNGLAITVQATNITATSSSFSGGIDKGEHWFRATYRFAEDYVAAVADNQGNVVSCEPTFISAVGYNPIKLFPWGHPQVSNNTVHNSLFLCVPGEARIEYNEFKAGSVVISKFQAGDVFTCNRLRGQSFTKIVTVGASNISDNDASGTNIDMQLISGDMTGNRLLDSQCSLGGSTFEMVANSLNNTILMATAASFKLLENEMIGATIDISGALSEYVVGQNQVKNNATVTLQRAQGQFVKNVVAQSEVTGNDSNTIIQGNHLRNSTTLTVTDFTGAQFFFNVISFSTVNLLDSTGIFNLNRIDSSTIQMQRHTGDCTTNVFAAAQITSNDSGSNIESNHIDQSVVQLSNTNGHFASNKATNSSFYNLDGYLGERVLLCSLLGSSTLIGNGNTQEQGRLTLNELTTLDISNESCIMYLSNFKVPDTTLVMKDSQINVVCEKHFSTVYHTLDLMPDGTLDTDVDELRYGGFFGVSSSGTLTGILGIATLPIEFVIKAVGSVNITIDTVAAGIKVANGVTLGILNGVDNHYVKISQANGYLVITEAYTS